MSLERYEVDEERAYSGYVRAGDFVFLSFCVGNVGESVERQVEGALDHMSARLHEIGLTLESVVKVDVLLRDVWDIPVMEDVFRRRFQGHYPARKTISTDFAHRGGQDGLKVQIASLAALVSSAASEGDASARLLLAEAGRLLGETAYCLLAKLPMGGAFLGMAGSVFGNPLVRRSFADHVKRWNSTQLVKRVDRPPVLGAVLLSFHQLGIAVTPELLDRLDGSWSSLVP